MTPFESELVLLASIDTVIEAGLLPDRIEDMPAHTKNWCRLMRRQEPRLRSLTDAELMSALNEI